MAILTIGKLAKSAQVRVDTIRFYEKCGLLQPQRRPSGFREYTQDHLLRLVFIRRARSLGFSLEEIDQLIRVDDEHDTSKLQRAVGDHLRVIDGKISALREWRSALLGWQSQRASTLISGSLVNTMSAPVASSDVCDADCDCTLRDRQHPGQP